ncbi:MAG: fibronectin type III domain-containing protein [Chromatiales bacterium]
MSLSELEGYRVYYGTDKDDLNALVDLNDSAETTYIVTGLSPGIYYFAVTAYDFDGLESGYSEIVSKEVY